MEHEKEAKARKFCGKDWDGMNKVLDKVCEIEDRLDLSDEEQEAYDIAVQCITTVMNRMGKDIPIT